MSKMNRRGFLGAMAAGVALGAARSNRLMASEQTELKRQPVPMIHVTDLFRPHNDPDDHYDLASVYALAYTGQIDLKGVLLDFAPNPVNGRNPDVVSVAQMNYITALNVPVSVGSPHPMRSRDDSQPYATPSDHVGIDMVLDILRQSPEPVAINVIGSCRDIAVAGNKAPKLFSEKCAGVYLNAGTGSPDKTQAAKLEYNVSLAALSYAAIFDLPCPVYWMPCFEQMRSGKSVMEYGTHYQFLQNEILPHLSPRMQNFFLYMLSRKTDANWLRYLLGSVDQDAIKTFGDLYRHMWCTGGFLHAARKTVTVNGQIVPLGTANDQAVFSFDPIKIQCSDQGVTEWKHDTQATDRYIFHVRNVTGYEQALTQSLKTLLKTLP